MQEDKILEGLFGGDFQLAVKNTTECEECSDCGKSSVIVPSGLTCFSFSLVTISVFSFL